MGQSWWQEYLNNNNNYYIDNYVIPGLRSYIIQSGPWGNIRLFHMTRSQLTCTAPHSHRYSLTSTVLSGRVENIIWNKDDDDGDLFDLYSLKYKGKPGEYTKRYSNRFKYSPYKTEYNSGSTYQMSNVDIHSINFDKDTVLLIHEGISNWDTSFILQPDDIDTFSIEPWMFKTNN